MARGAKILRARRIFARLRVVVGWRNFMFLKKSSDFFRILYWHPSVHPHSRDCIRLFAKPDKTQTRFVILSEVESGR